MLKTLKDAAVASTRAEAETRDRVALLRERLSESRDVAEKTRASEVAEAKLEDLRTNRSVGARLGQLLVTRNLKVTDLIVSWDSEGTGEVDVSEFRHHVLSIGLQAEPSEVDELFNILDEDGGGTLDMNEVKHALKTLQDAASNADLEISRLKKATVDLWKTAKVAQVEFKKVQKSDEAVLTAKQKIIEAEIEARTVVEEKAKLRREKAAAEKRQAAEAERQAFEAKIAARRKATQEVLDAELKSFSAKKPIVTAQGSGQISAQGSSQIFALGSRGSE